MKINTAEELITKESRKEHYGKPEIKKFLHNVAIFRGNNNDDLENISSAAIEKRYKKGEVIIREGDIISDVYVVLKGKAFIYKTSPTGNALLIGVRKEGETFGFLVIMGGRPNFASVKAAEDLILLKINRADIIKYFHRNPDAVSVAIEQGFKMLELHSKLLEFAIKPTKERIVETLITLYNVFGCELAYTHQDIADMAGTTIETLSRTFYKWKIEGLIRLNRGKIVIVNINRLNECLKRQK